MKEIIDIRGDAVELNKAYNCDCYDFMKSIPDNSIDLLLTDPPYGINAGKMTMGSGQNKQFDKGKTWDSKIPDAEVFKEMLRVSKRQIIWGGNYFTEFLEPSPNWLVWDKKNPNLSFAEGELAWVNEGKLLRICALFSGNQEKLHPTQKPLKLFSWCISQMSEFLLEQEDAVIFDPYLGSGTTAEAAYLANVDWIGCELDADYIDVINTRMKNARKQPGFDF